MEPQATASALLLSRNSPTQLVHSVLRDKYKQSVSSHSVSLLYSHSLSHSHSAHIFDPIYTQEVLYVGMLFQIAQVGSRVNSGGGQKMSFMNSSMQMHLTEQTQRHSESDAVYQKTARVNPNIAL